MASTHKTMVLWCKTVIYLDLTMAFARLTMVMLEISIVYGDAAFESSKPPR
jgi:hypothetical protein